MEKRLTQRLRIICQGNAKRFGLRIKGKRNQLGMTLGRRTDVWQSGTAMALAVFCRSNTHTAPNYRMPPLAVTHDDEYCNKACYSKSGQMKVTCKLAQRAQREATGYYCGYTFKRQACGRFVLRATAESLNYVELGLKDKSAGRQWYKICNRMITDWNHRCTMRTAPDEFNLSANQHKHDPMTAEFIRSYMSVSFPGQRFINLLESEMKGEMKRLRQGVLPVRAETVEKEVIRTYHLEEIYGYRGQDERVYYLSPWEFVMFWEVHRVTSPNSDSNDDVQVSRWTGVKIQKGSIARAGTHYVINGKVLKDHPDYVMLPDTTRLSTRLRHEWVLRRAFRPFVPQPDRTPMPDRAKNHEERAKLYSVYLRP